MKKLLNTLYVLTPESYLFLRNETIGIQVGGEEKLSVPAKDIDGIVCFGQMTVSTPLIGFCGERGITLTFLSDHGRFLGRICGPVSGNVLLRKKQYRTMDDPAFSKQVAQDILLAKFRNSKEVLMRHARIATECESEQILRNASTQISELAQQIVLCDTIDSMRGVEGAAANAYFGCFDNMIHASDGMRFEMRSRRPPRNEINATLSFVYMLLTREMQWALETVGLDPAAGYIHTLRPGRPSFALDMIEELRAPLCDRFVLSMFNKRQLNAADFALESAAVYLGDNGRKKVLSAWQKRKAEVIVHPFLEQKVQLGMICYVQAMLFARVLRGDLDRYPPFVWR